MSKIGVAGLQLESVNGDNLDMIEAEIDAVCRRFPWIDMVVLGELNAYGVSTADAQPTTRIRRDGHKDADHGSLCVLRAAHPWA